MPRAIEQKPKPMSSKTASVLDRIGPLRASKIGRLKCSFYGLPKCLGEGTPILMFDGSVKSVENIVVGDELMGPDSLPRKVLSISSGFGPLYRVKPKKGDSWVCNDAHVLTLAGTCKNMGKIRDVSIKELLREAKGQPLSQVHWRLLRTSVRFQRQEPLEIPPYLVGLWMGDGHRRGAEITNSKPPIHDYCKKIAVDLGLKCSITERDGAFCIAFSLDSEDSWQGRPDRNKLRTFVRNECNVGELKKIPQRYLTASRQDRLSLLAGILDTDGKTTNSSWTTVVVTGELYRDDLLYLCRSLGFAANSKKTKVHVCSNGKVSTYYQIIISGNLDEVPTLVRRFPKRRQEKRVNVVGFTLKKLKNNTFYGFTLDGDGRFLLGDFTVTHNSGKTRLACTFPKPLLLIGAEDGTASVVGSKGVSFVQIYHCDEFMELVNGPIKNGDYATVVLDTATKMRDMRISEILGHSQIALQKGWGFASRDQWTECANSMKELLRPLLDLPNKTELNVVIIAQEGLLSDDGKGVTDVIKPAVTSALGRSLALYINAECDYICQTFIRQQTVERKIEGTDAVETIATGKKQFCLRIGPHEIYTTGFRVPLGVKEPPEVIVSPTYDKIVQVINGTYKE